MLQQRQAFQCELDAIDAKVIELFGLVVPELARATASRRNTPRPELSDMVNKLQRNR
jgi:hypothetical protein